VKTVYMLWSEWEIGESNVAFASKEAGRRWLVENEVIKEMAEDDKAEINSYVDELLANGYFDWQVVMIFE